MQGLAEWMGELLSCKCSMWKQDDVKDCPNVNPNHSGHLGEL